MTGRRIAVLVAVGVVAAALVGLSAAATTSGGDSRKAAKPARTTTQKPSPAKQSASEGTAVSSPESGQQTSGDAASYWTKERMENAQPAAKTIPGGGPASSPAPVIKQVSPASTPSRSAPAKKPSKKRTSQADGVTSSPDTAGNAADYWTQDEMDSAQPMGPTVEGGNGAGQGSSEAPVQVSPAGTP